MPSLASLRRFGSQKVRTARQRIRSATGPQITGVITVAVLLTLWVGIGRYVSPTTADERTAVVTVVAQIAGGVILAIGVFWTARNVQTNREGQITERFTRAIDQLGAADNDGRPQIETRLGAIYGLERIARDSARDRGPIIEILTAYVREHSPWPPVNPEHLHVTYVGAPSRREPPLKADVQAILTVIGRLPSQDMPEPRLGIDLSATDLRGYDLSKAHLSNADFQKSQLGYIRLVEAQVEGGGFVRTDLRGAFLNKANLQRSMFYHADLRAANLSEANLQGAMLYKVQWDDAVLDGADLTGVVIDNPAAIRNAESRVDLSVDSDINKLLSD